jgi:hypothetical protein
MQQATLDKCQPSSHLLVALENVDVEANNGNNLSGPYSFPVLCHMNLGLIY